MSNRFLSDATLIELIDELYQEIQDSPVRMHSPFCLCQWCKLRTALVSIDQTRVPDWGK